MKIYSVYDKKAESFSPPYVAHNDLIALRNFEGSVNNPEFPIIRSEMRIISQRTIESTMLFTVFSIRTNNISHKHGIKTNHIITVTDYNGL